MTTAKSYTNLEQSRKLAEILPLESADMYYEPSAGFRTEPSEAKFGDIKYAHPRSIRCWSLAALLEIIKKLVGYSLQSLDTHTVFMNCELGGKPYNIETENYDNPIDACVAMIERLHELNLL